MTRRFYSAVILTLALFVTGPVAAQPAAVDAETDAAARQLLAVTRMAENTKALYGQQVARIMGQLQQNQPHLPGRAFDILEEEFDAIVPILVDEMIDISVVMYAERFTAAEMVELAAFYESDLGQKALTQLRTLSASSAEQGRALGERLGRQAAERAVERIKAEGVDTSPPPPK